jgi:CubicO group peptidase (beta-lactamase class C family)
MVNSKAQEAVQKSLDSVTGDKSTGVAGLVFVAVDKNGDASASGKTGLNSKEDMSLDSIFWIASCTKILATIACLQAVEQGKLDLDDSKQVYKLCPELEKVKVLQEDGSLVDKKKEITLRMLLSHTAGFGYEL